MVYYGMWFTPLREALDAFFESSQRRVTGTVGLSLFKGNVNVTSREIAVFALSHQSGELHDDRLQPERCRRLHQSVRVADNDPGCERRGALSEAAQKKMWGGRFERAPDEEFYEFERSFGFDRRLLPFEFALDRAWSRGLEEIGILSADGGADRFSRRSSRSKSARRRTEMAGRFIRRGRASFR